MPNFYGEVAEPLSLVTDEQGFMRFQCPQRVEVSGIPFGFRYTLNIEPLQRDGRVLLVRKYNVALIHESETANTRRSFPSNPEIIKMQEGHLLVGRVINAKSNQPLARSDDGKPIRIAFADKSWDGEGFPQNGSPVLEVDANGIFQCYMPEGVCWPFILPNGNDQIWPRTNDYQQWQKQGVLIKPGKITTVEFRVAPRLDSDAPTAELPVLEEQAAAAKLVMLGGKYELDENRHVKSVVWSTHSFGRHWSLIGDFKYLTTLNFDQIIETNVNDDAVRQILEMPMLTTLIVICLKERELPYNGERKTIEGKENSQQFLNEELPKNNAWVKETKQ
jgi:hypothetical protein